MSEKEMPALAWTSSIRQKGGKGIFEQCYSTATRLATIPPNVKRLPVALPIANVQTFEAFLDVWGAPKSNLPASSVTEQTS